MGLAENLQRGVLLLDERFPGWLDTMTESLAPLPDLDGNWLSLLLRGKLP